MDPNAIGRGVHGYSSFLGAQPDASRVIRRLFVHDLSPNPMGTRLELEWPI